MCRVSCNLGRFGKKESLKSKILISDNINSEFYKGAQFRQTNPNNSL